MPQGIDLPPLGGELGTGFGLEALTYGATGAATGSQYVYDFGDVEARDLRTMLRRDYKARQIENVLTLPILSAEWTIDGEKGDTGEAEWLREYWATPRSQGGCESGLDEIIAQALSSVTYRRAYFELVFKRAQGKIVYDKVALRPATTCRLRRGVRNSAFLGFDQQPPVALANSKMDWVQIPAKRAYVHIHGTRHDPLWGKSDLDIAYNSWALKQKLTFLWMQFMEQVALPRVIVKAQNMQLAQTVAKQVAGLRNSGVLPVSTDGGTGDDAVAIDSLDVSGKGSEQFMQAIAWLDRAATNSVLAGFLDLTGQASNANSGQGSYALSSDASSYFFASRESDTRELELSIERRLFEPLIRYNFGPNGKVPRLQFEPLAKEDRTNAMSLLTELIKDRNEPQSVPDDFIAELAGMVGQYIGMDQAKVEKQFTKAASDASKAAADKGANGVQQGLAAIGGVVNAADNLRDGVAHGDRNPDRPVAGPVGPAAVPVPQNAQGDSGEQTAQA